MDIPLHSYVLIKVYHRVPYLDPLFSTSFVGYLWRSFFANHTDDNGLFVIREQLLDVKYALEADTKKLSGSLRKTT